jgi:hypothetical protein
MTWYLQISAMKTNQSIIFAGTAVALIVVPFMVFLSYEQSVSRQQKLLVSSAQRSNAIVDSLFPSNIRDMLYPQEMEDPNGTNKSSGAPIAELHPDTTVIFAGMYAVIDSAKVNIVVDTELKTLFHVFSSRYSQFHNVVERSGPLFRLYPVRNDLFRF